MTDHDPMRPQLTLSNRSFGPAAGAALSALLGDPPLVSPASFSLVPVVVSRDYLHRLSRLSALLDTAFRVIVSRYFLDARIRAVYQLPKAMDDILRLADGRPFHVGFYRPDFVYDLCGQPRICEIGARYPMNGWIVSLIATRVFADHVTGTGLGVQTEQDAFLQTLCEMHPRGSSVAMIHARERGTEIFWIRDEFQRRGVEFLQAHPSELCRADGRLRVRDRVVDRCILEMDRTELPLIPADALEYLLDTGGYFNDVRTLILVHDKRVLAVLDDADIMRDCMDPADYAELRQYLIPSRIVASEAACEAMLALPGNFIAKVSSGGRGVDTIVRSACGEAAWRELVLRDWSRYMFQEYVGQKEFQAPHDGQRIHLVGMQLCHDHISYGAGVFRGSDELVINVHQKRGLLFPAMVCE